ncbi:MAG: hypothetical protein KF874_13415 [Rhizobiaceae bacterium]|nr:hypothetical protein [Rhizobiaceae bacterium]
MVPPAILDADQEHLSPFTDCVYVPDIEPPEIRPVNDVWFPKKLLVAKDMEDPLALPE